MLGKFVFPILLAISLLSCSRDCDPYTAWVNDYKIFSIVVDVNDSLVDEQVEVYFEDILNPKNISKEDRILRGITISYTYWRIDFQPDGSWSSNISIRGTKSIPFLGGRVPEIIGFSIVLRGSYKVSGNTYDLFILNVKH